MKFKMLLSLIIVLTSAFLSAASFRLEDMLQKHGTLIWELNQEQLRIVTKYPLKSQDKFDNVLRFFKKDTPHRMTICEHMVPEVLFYFNKRKLQYIVISVYNRGDDGIISEGEFDSLNAKLEKFIVQLSKCTKPISESRKFDKFRVDSFTYKSKTADYVIRRNRKGSAAEYIQLFIYPAGKAPKLHEALRTGSDRKSLSLNVIKDRNGDVYLDIPMVNQGNKGYCVAATIERIMKYYGSNIDQQIIAQLAETDSYRGTNVRKFYNAISSHDSKLKIRVDKLYHDDMIEKVDDIESFNSIYNNLAKKRKRPRIRLKDFSKGRGRYRRVNLPALIGAYEYSIFRAARCRRERMTEKFKEIVHEHLDKGIPLVWITYVFQNTQKTGQIGKVSMHMRIINGYNEEKNTIIYTDSWGKGHEKKRFSVNDAWAHTLMLIAVTPR